MGHSGLTLLGAALGLAMCGVLSACGTGGSTAGNTAPPPAGVDPALWQQLSRELAQALERTASAPGSPPLGQAARVSLDYDAGSARLSWYCQAPGDYDQNGEVNASDLIPLAQRLGASSPAGEGQPWPVSALEHVIDGDGNGVLNLADVTVIAQHWKERCEGYRIYRATDPALWPIAPDDANGAGSQLEGSLLLSEAQGGGAFRLRFSYQLVPTATSQWYWVRPYSASLDGAASLLSPEIVIIVPQNEAPLARLEQPPAMGTAAHVVWDASQSLDADGGIVKFEFDFGADGVYDLTHELVDPDGSGGNPPFWTGGGGPGGTGEPGKGNPALADFYYYSPGSFACRVRVTDNLGAQGISPVRTVEVSEVQKWRKNWLPDEFSAVGEFGISQKLLEVAGRPAVFVTNQSSLRPGVYTIATDEFGTAWNTPLTANDVVTEDDNIGWIDAAIIKDRPAVIGREQVQENPKLFRLVYLRANDEEGLDWPNVLTPVQSQPVEADGDGSYMFCLTSVAGRPTIMGRDGMIASEDALGMNWGQFQPFQGQFTPQHSEVRDLRIIGGVAYLPKRNSSLDLLIYSADSTDPRAWGAPRFATSLESIGAAYGIEDVLGKVGAFYFESGAKVLRFRRALTPELDNWGAAIDLDDKASQYFKFTTVAGRPAVLYRNRESNIVYFRSANNLSGSYWSTPAAVDIGIVSNYLDNYSTGSSPSSRSTTWFAGVGASPAFLCKEDDPATPQSDLKLRLAMYH